MVCIVPLVDTTVEGHQEGLDLPYLRFGGKLVVNTSLLVAEILNGVGCENQSRI